MRLPALGPRSPATLEQAIAFHGGEAGAAALRYFALTLTERLAVQTLLKSLAVSQ